jgi:hypothetical protein
LFIFTKNRRFHMFSLCLWLIVFLHRAPSDGRLPRRSAHLGFSLRDSRIINCIHFSVLFERVDNNIFPLLL